MDFDELFKKLKRDARAIEIDSSASYIQAYPEFIKYFKALGRIQKHHFFIGIHFVYGWMPTTPTLHTQELKKVLSILNKVRTSKDVLTINELEILSQCINNSMVGTSKLLHFINPKKYAIWDRRVLRYLSALGVYWAINNPENYRSYLEKIHGIANIIGYKKLHAFMESKCGYKIEPTRAIEMIMYETDRNIE